MTSVPYNPSLHRFALVTTAATFPLIFMGGLVTSHGAGMSVPDWPNSYGYNMFTFPPSKWVGGIFYEHTHRLMGTLVGMLSIALAFWGWRTERRRWVRWLATGVLAAVIVQGLLGGLRVVLVELDLAIVHACFAQAFFCLAALVCVVTSKWWHDATPQAASTSGRRLIAACVFAVIAIYAQLIVGATMRHYEAGLAVPDLPLAFGKLLPPISESELTTAQARLADVTEAGWDWRLPAGRPSLSMVWLHFSHRVGALVVTAAAGWLVFRISRDHRSDRALTIPAAALSLLIVTQITLGVLTILLRKPADIASAHVAVGALTLLTAFVLLARSMRQHSNLARATPRGFTVSHAFQGAIGLPA